MSKPDQAETAALLARVRKTIADSEAMIDQVNLRRQETDRLLESMGLTREKVAAMRFTPRQLEAANAELRRRGLPTIATSETVEPSAEAYEEPVEPRLSGAGRATEPSPDADDAHEDLDNRRRKLGAMMNRYRL